QKKRGPVTDGAAFLIESFIRIPLNSHAQGFWLERKNEKSMEKWKEGKRPSFSRSRALLLFLSNRERPARDSSRVRIILRQGRSASVAAIGNRSSFERGGR